MFMCTLGTLDARLTFRRRLATASDNSSMPFLAPNGGEMPPVLPLDESCGTGGGGGGSGAAAPTFGFSGGSGSV
jgi:uncharacterized membrane protein YgcG